MIKKISKLISNHSHLAVILSIAIVIILAPYYWDSSLEGVFNFTLFTLILLSSILTLNKSGVKSAKFGNIGYLIIILTLVSEITQDQNIEFVTRIIFILYLVYVAVNLLIEIIKSREVDTEIIYSAVAVYLLFGFCGALLTAVIIYFEPAAFSLDSVNISVFHQCLYFSFVTLTTTGYGDIIPLAPIAKTLAIFLAVFGQLYLTVIIGILIGKYISGREKTN